MSGHTTPDLSTAALITIDTQCDTLDGGPFEIPGTSAILPNIRALLGEFRKAQNPIVHIVRIYKPDGSNVDLCRRELIEQGAKLLLAGSQGCELASELLPDEHLRLDANLLLSGGIQPLGPNEVVIYKPRWGAFYKTPLEEHLRRLGVSTLVFTGCNFPNCPRTSIYEASERDFRLIVVEDALSGLYDLGKEEIGQIGVDVIRTAELIGRLQKRA